MCYDNSKIYQFGGFSRDVYQDMRVLDLNKKRWHIVTPENIYDTPPSRCGHSMCIYKNNLVVFGGAGAFNNGLRVCYKFVHIFDTSAEKWLKSVDNTPHEVSKPNQRAYHASAVFGNIMLLYGGLNTEDKSPYDDFHLYDIDLNSWILAKRSHLATEAFGSRCMHTMTTVISSECKLKFNLSMWLKYQRDMPNTLPSKHYGVYLFGGYKTGEGQMNDLWVIKPKHRSNADTLSQRKNYVEYKDEIPTLYVDIVKLEPDGVQPPPRMMHAAVQFGERYLGKLRSGL